MSLKGYIINEYGKMAKYNKVKTAIERIKFAYEVSLAQGKGALYVAFSGGKDSMVLAELCLLSGVPYELHYNITGIDPPEVIYFMRDNFHAIDGETMQPIFPRKKRCKKKRQIDLYWHKYKKSMWRLIVDKHMPPTRIVRYCCAELKEGGGVGRICLTGVRKAESVKRSKRKAFEIVTSKASEKMLFNDNDEDRLLFENCQKKGKHVVNPIIDWLDEDVWEFTRLQKLKQCCLYSQGFSRIGCIGCPQGSTKQQERDFKRYPKFKQLYINAFDRMLESMPNKAIVTWKTGQDVFDWWLYGDAMNKPCEGQIEIEYIFLKDKKSKSL